MNLDAGKDAAYRSVYAETLIRSIVAQVQTRAAWQGHEFNSPPTLDSPDPTEIETAKRIAKITATAYIQQFY